MKAQVLLVALSALIVPATVVNAQTKPKPKPPVKKPSVAAPTKGTAQMPGDNGKVGVVYQLGDKDNELHFSLESATLATRYGNMSDLVVAGPNQRILILTCVAHNPLKREMNLGWNTFGFTAVSPDDENSKHKGYIYHPEKRTRLDSTMKPAQKIRFTLAMPIHAEGPITKLIVERGSGAVLRYDLRNNTTGPISVFTKKDNVSLGNEATVDLNQTFDLGAFDMEIQEVMPMDGPVGQYKSTESEQLYVVTIKATNTLMIPTNFGWQYCEPKLTDENGENVDWRSDLVSIAGGKTIAQEVDPGAFVRGRYIFTGPKGLKFSQFRLLHHGTQRTIFVKKF